MFQLQQKKYSFLQMEGKVHSLSQRGGALHRQKSLPLVPKWSFITQMRTPDSQFECSEKHSLDWSAKMLMWYSCTGLVGKVSVLLLKIRLQNSFTRAGSDGRNIVEGGSSVQEADSLVRVRQEIA